MSDQDDIALRECLEPVWFRVEAQHWANVDDWGYVSSRHSALKIIEIPVLKHTPKGAWIGARPGEIGMAKKLVLREYQHRARAYAAPTLDQAKEDFRKRKLYRIACLQAEIQRAEREIQLLGPILKDHP